jgi:hypothetical protein
MSGRKGPLGPLGQQEPCIRCFKPETNRGFMIEGDAEWTAAAISHYGNVPITEALGMVRDRYEAEGMDLADRDQTTVRLCRGCAALTDAPVYSLARLHGGAEVRGVVQPID